MTDQETKDLLNNKELKEIESSIATTCKTYVNKENEDFYIGSLEKEISNSGLTVDYIRQQLKIKKESIIRFGILLLNEVKDEPIEEEYPRGESIPKNQRPKIIKSLGLGTGFGVKYAIYIDFLENRPDELLNYIEIQRIPKAKKFCETLFKLYNA